MAMLNALLLEACILGLAVVPSSYGFRKKFAGSASCKWYGDSIKTLCLECNPGYYHTGPVSDYCAACLESCETCEEYGWKCTECRTGYIPHPTIPNRCVESRTDVRYTCSGECTSCSQRDSSCDSCPPGFVKVKESESSSNYVCWVCTEYCLVCDTTDIGKCKNCTEGFNLHQGRCIPFTCGSYTRKCSRCADFRYCAACTKGAYLSYYNWCQDCAPGCAECKDYTGECTACLPRHYSISTTECAECDESCAGCTDYPWICTNCSQGYERSNTYNGLACIKSGQCSYQSCYQTDENACISDDWISKNAEAFLQCAKCHAFDRETRRVQCTECTEGYFNIGDKRDCRNACPTDIFCKSCADRQGCTSCYGSYVLEPFTFHGYTAHKCTLCDARCKKCSSATYCRECMEGYIPADGKCMPYCNGRCDLCGPKNRCLQCSGQHLKYDGTCVVEDCLPKNCDVCSTVNTCLVCKPGLYPSEEDGWCIACPQQHCKNCTAYECLECFIKQRNPDDSCRECDVGCKVCSSYDVCLECEAGYSLQNVISKQGRTAKVVCIKCPSNCWDCEHPDIMETGDVANQFAFSHTAGVEGLQTAGDGDLQGLGQLKDDGSKKCLRCADGYALMDNGQCHRCNALFCTRCQPNSSDCQKCLPFFHPVNGLCKPCSRNCVQCYNGGDCLRCSHGEVDQGFCTDQELHDYDEYVTTTSYDPRSFSPWCTGGTYWNFSNLTLAGEQEATQDATNQTECMKTCKDRGGCGSVNFYKNGTCELLKEDELVPTYLKENSDSDHYREYCNHHVDLEDKAESSYNSDEQHLKYVTRDDCIHVDVNKTTAFKSMASGDESLISNPSFTGQEKNGRFPVNSYMECVLHCTVSKNCTGVEYDQKSDECILITKDNGHVDRTSTWYTEPVVVYILKCTDKPHETQTHNLDDFLTGHLPQAWNDSSFIKNPANIESLKKSIIGEIKYGGFEDWMHGQILQDHLLEYIENHQETASWLLPIRDVLVQFSLYDDLLPNVAFIDRTTGAQVCIHGTDVIWSEYTQRVERMRKASFKVVVDDETETATVYQTNYPEREQFVRGTTERDIHSQNRRRPAATPTVVTHTNTVSSTGYDINTGVEVNCWFIP